MPVADVVVPFVLFSLVLLMLSCLVPSADLMLTVAPVITSTGTSRT